MTAFCWSKEVTKINSDSRGGEIDSILWWVERHACTRREGINGGYLWRLCTTYIFQISRSIQLVFIKCEVLAKKYFNAIQFIDFYIVLLFINLSLPPNQKNTRIYFKVLILTFKYLITLELKFFLFCLYIWCESGNIQFHFIPMWSFFFLDQFFPLIWHVVFCNFHVSSCGLCHLEKSL